MAKSESYENGKSKRDELMIGDNSDSSSGSKNILLSVTLRMVGVVSRLEWRLNAYIVRLSRI